MGDRVRAGRGADGRDMVRKGSAGRDAANAGRRAADEAERLGRDQQRRATAYGRARGRL